MPERRMSSCVMTKIAAATSVARSSFRDADVTSTFIRSSIETFKRSGTFVCAKPLDTGSIVESSDASRTLPVRAIQRPVTGRER